MGAILPIDGDVFVASAVYGVSMVTRAHEMVESFRVSEFQVFRNSYIIDAGGFACDQLVELLESTNELACVLRTIGAMDEEFRRECESVD